VNGWENFFIAEIAASAPLAGLVLVGVSLNLEQIMAHPVYGLPGRALETLVMLLAVLVISTLMLVPEQTLGVIGAEVLGVGLQSILGNLDLSGRLRNSLNQRQFHGGGFAV
jgi:hypothetical protein